MLALFPLAMHGGPLWHPCCAQIGGLTVATFITLLMVPIFYSILVLDLKILTWDAKEDKTEGGASTGASTEQPSMVAHMTMVRCSDWRWFAPAQRAVDELRARLVMAEREAKCGQVKASQKFGRDGNLGGDKSPYCS